MGKTKSKHPFPKNGVIKSRSGKSFRNSKPGPSAKISRSQQKQQSSKRQVDSSKKKTNKNQQQPDVQLQLPPRQRSGSTVAPPWLRKGGERGDSPTISLQSTQQTNSSSAVASDITGVSSERNSKNKTRLPTDDVPADALQALDDEILSFAQYIQLTAQERATRDHVIHSVQNIASALFSKQQGQHLRWPDDNEEECTNSNVERETVHIEVFGSYATPPVCTFTSDVDLALWGVVAPEASAILQAKKPSLSTRDSSSSAAGTSGASTNSANSKLERKRKWREALAIVDAANEAANGHVDLHTSEERIPEIALCNEIISKTEGDNMVRDKRDARKDEVNESDSVTELFVIDRVGECSDGLALLDKPSHPSPGNAPDMPEEQSSSEPALPEPTIFMQCNKRETIDTPDDEDSVQIIEPIMKSNGICTKEYLSSNDSQFDDVDDDSENDSADALAAFDQRRGSQEKESARYVSESISSCSDNVHDSECDSEGEPCKKNSGMEVSFVSPPHMTLPGSSFGPTGRIRRLVVDALVSLSRSLRRSHLVDRVQVIKNARVPIIKISTSFDFEVDIAMGGHNGADTSHFAASQLERYKSFSPVVLFLKALLAQQDLDAPFTGGLGSYKLYVLVAKHIQQHTALGGSDRPGEILLSFLFRYGSVAGHNVPSETRTKLTTKSVIWEESGGCADLSNVFKIENCIHLFAQGWHRLWRSTRKNDQKSFLAELVDAQRISQLRKASTSKATASARSISACSEQNIPTSGVPTSSRVHEQNTGSKRRPSRSGDTNKRRRIVIDLTSNKKPKKRSLKDRSAEDIIASYHYSLSDL